MFRLVGRRAARTICWLRVPVLAALVAGVWVLFFASGAGARTGAYRLAILRVSYSDAATHLWTLAQYQSAATEIHDFYTRLSYGQLNMQVAVADVALRQTQGFYWNACAQSGEQRNPCPPTLIEDATQAAAAGGFSFKGVDGILVVSSFCSGDFTNGPIDIARPGVNGRFQRSYDFECALPGSLNSPGGSGVAWNGWAHEIGHQLQLDEGDVLGGNWNGHPSGYASGYDLMDSCYPCGESLYGLSGPPIMNGSKQVFPGFLPASRVVTVLAPPAGAPSKGATVTITPLGLQPGQPGYPLTPAAIKVPIGEGQYYEVTGRSDIGADAYSTGPGLWDQGVRIRRIDEAADPPVTNIEACDTTVSGGCVHDSKTDSRAAACNASPPPRQRGDVPDYCWPYPLWHTGQTFDDPSNQISIRVDAELTQPFLPQGPPPFTRPGPTAFTITVTRGPQRRNAPDVYIRPAFSPPFFTFESTDLWIDSSCNGYEHNYLRSLRGGAVDFGVGRIGLRYGRNRRGEVVGNGDDVCLDHPNRIYVELHNLGDRTARNVRVHIEAQLLPGVEIPSIDFGLLGLPGTDSRPLFPPNEIGTATVASLRPGGSTDVYVTWTPKSPPGTPLFGRTEIPIGLLAHADPVAGELVTDNQQSEEAIDYFEATGGARYTPILAISGAQNGPRIVGLVSPKSTNGTQLRIAKGQHDFQPNGRELHKIPLSITPGPHSPGSTQYMPITVGGITQLRNQAIPDGYPVPRTHDAYTSIAGATIAIHTVRPTTLTIQATRKANTNTITVRGQLTPRTRAEITVDLATSNRLLQSKTIRTNKSGHFYTTLRRVSKQQLTVHALWEGNQRDESASSNPVTVAELGRG